jgi:hypothetical protein
MDEQKTKPEEKPEEPTSDADEGDKPTASGIVDRAGVNAEKLDKAAERAEAAVKRLEDLEALRKLGGETGGAAPEEVKTEETPKEYNDRINKEMSEGKHGE